MKNLIFILFVFISTSVVAQNNTGKQYIPWLKSDAITIPGPADDATQKGYFIWHGDTIDFTMLTDSTIVYEQDSTVLFITLKQLVDSLNALPGGHSAVTIGANGTTAGLSITGQELNMQSATAARNGYLTAIDFSNFYSKLSLVVHTNLLSGNGTTVSPLSINTDSIAKRSWVLAQNYINENQLHYDSLAGLPTLPVIENIAFDAGWDGDLDGASKNVIYDAIAALPGGHDELTLSDSALFGGLSVTGQLLDFQRVTSSQNGFATSTNYNKWETATTLATAFTGTGKFVKSSASSGRAVQQTYMSEAADYSLTIGGLINSSPTFGYSVGLGYGALESDDKTNNYNIGLGHSSLNYISSGEYNIALGYDAGRFYGPNLLAVNNTTSNHGIFIGANTRPLTNGGTNEIVIGKSAVGNGSNTITLGDTTITNLYTYSTVNAENAKLSQLAGTGNRIAIVNSLGLFSGIKKDSISYWNDAYARRIATFTTTESSGAATFTGNTLNIPNYTLTGLGGVPTSRTITINGTTYDLSANRTWTVSGGSGTSPKIYEGLVTDRNIDLTIADYTPSDKDIIEVIAEDDISDGDTLTLSINGGTAYNIYDYTAHDKDYALRLMYLDAQWYVLSRFGEEASLKGNVDATNLIVDTDGIQYVGLGEDSFTDNTLVPMWWVLQQLAADNNSTQTLVGTTPYWNVVNGKNAAITLTGTTTITMSNLTDGDEGTLYVTNGSSSSYRITFAGYSVQIYPSVWYSGDEVAVSGSSKTDVFTYKYIGAGINKVIINGALDVK